MESIPEFTNIHNFRQVSSKLPAYRSANWDTASQDDIAKARRSSFSNRSVAHFE